MSGYSIRMARSIEEADGNLLGVQLGRVCLARDIPVAEAAREVGVTRQTIYLWFLGLSNPRGAMCQAIEDYLTRLG
jgi:DNA-binding phage protein